MTTAETNIMNSILLIFTLTTSAADSRVYAKPDAAPCRSAASALQMMVQMSREGREARETPRKRRSNDHGER
jgi:hypothetical protein